MEDYSDENVLFVHFSHKFKAIRVVENQMFPTEWTLKADVLIPEEKNDDFSFNLALMKIRFWFDNVVISSIMFAHDNAWAKNAFIGENGPSTDNVLFITPDEPTDDHLVIVLQSKMNALADGALFFGGVELNSDNAKGLGFTYLGDGEQLLPEMKDWVGEHTFFERPWWGRNDSSTFDIVPKEDDDLDNPPLSFDLDFLSEALRPHASYQDKPAKVIRAEFKPKIIKGNKTDND